MCKLAGTCLYVQLPGKMQDPRFHDIQMLSDLHLVIGVEVMGAWAVGGVQAQECALCPSVIHLPAQCTEQSCLAGAVAKHG